MNKKQRITYSALFAEPIRRNILWNDVVSLILAFDGKVLQGDGSRVRFDLNGVSLNIHSPHPQKELKRYQVKAVREFLVNAGVDL
jgi:HicA toxin of bacterial toxin-antitoxin,